MGAVVSALVGALLGLSLAAPPGPMNALIAAESLRSWRAGAIAGLGAMLADATFFLLAVGGVVPLVGQRPTLRRAMAGAGGLLMLYFAYGAARGAREGSGAVEGDAGGFRAAYLLAITNPYQVTWWLTAGVGLLSPGAVEVFGRAFVVGGGAVTVAGFFGGILCWITAFPATIRAAGRRLAAVEALLSWGSALVLAWFGAVFCYAALAGAA